MDAADMLRACGPRVSKSGRIRGSMNDLRPFWTNSWLGPMPCASSGNFFEEGAPNLDGAIFHPLCPTSAIAPPLCSIGGIPLPFCPREDTIMVLSLTMVNIPFPCSASDVTMPGSHSARHSAFLLCLLSPLRMSLLPMIHAVHHSPSCFVEDITPPLASRRTSLPPWLHGGCCFAVAVTLCSCSASDIIPPLSYTEEITLPYCLMEDVISPESTSPDLLLIYGL